MHLEEFAEGNSPIHSLDPRVKVAALFPFIIVVATAGELLVPFLALALGVILLLFSRLNLKAVLGRLYPVNLFIIFLWLVLPFTVEGREVFARGGLVLTAEGLFLALSITLKANAILLSTITLVGTIPVFRLAHTLRSLKIPEKLVNLFFFCYRYISVLHQDYSALHNAMKVRAFKPRTDVRTYRSYAYLIGMLVVRSYDHSDKIYQAMLCRGFKGRFPLLSHFTALTGKDYLFLIFMILVTVSLSGIELTGFKGLL